VEYIVYFLRFTEFFYFFILLSMFLLVKYRKEYDKKFGKNSFAIVITEEIVVFLLLNYNLTKYYSLISP